MGNALAVCVGNDGEAVFSIVLGCENMAIRGVAFDQVAVGIVCKLVFFVIHLISELMFWRFIADKNYGSLIIRP